MDKYSVRWLVVMVMLFTTTLSVSAQTETTTSDIPLRILTVEEGSTIAVLSDLLDAFADQHPEIQVELDIVPYAGFDALLLSQIEAGIAPDLARVTSFSAFSEHYLDVRPYLDNADAWDANFTAPLLEALRVDADSDALHGYPTNFTVSGPYINRTLFEQAGVSIPSDSSDEVTWDTWMTATTAAQSALSTPDMPIFALALDRSGHRFWGPSLSWCATYISEDGQFSVDSPGFRDAAQILYAWHQQQITPLEIWAGAGNEYRTPLNFFVDGQLAFYFSGSWLVADVGAGVGDAFDWEVVPSPVGPCGSSGMIGGAAMVAFRGTDHPEAVGQLLSFLTRADNLADYYRRSLSLPGSLELIEQGLDYPQFSAELNTFAAELPKVVPEAFTLQYHPNSVNVHSAIRIHLIDVMSDLQTLDEAIMAIQQDVDTLAGQR
ncbi:MAG: extracellular solute-binding protein [Chloroflexi bacterium]|nr:extracellular solute-binding protein [Chloroflexota bacterium]